MIIDCISDLHGHYPKLEGGDLLIVAGDLTGRHTFGEFAFEFLTWLEKQLYKKKIVVGGNHDTFLGLGAEKLIDKFGDYLFDSGTEFEELKMWGSPWTKTFPNMNTHCKAFTVDTEEELAEKWKLIPHDIDILVTHSPPWGNHDRSPSGENCGSVSLVHWCANHVNRCKLHVFGHIHNSYGCHDIRKFQQEANESLTTVFVNASHVNEAYQPVNKPIRIIL